MTTNNISKIKEKSKKNNEGAGYHRRESPALHKENSYVQDVVV